MKLIKIFLIILPASRNYSPFYFRYSQLSGRSNCVYRTNSPVLLLLRTGRNWEEVATVFFVQTHLYYYFWLLAFWMLRNRLPGSWLFSFVSILLGFDESVAFIKFSLLSGTEWSRLSCVIEISAWNGNASHSSVRTYPKPISQKYWGESRSEGVLCDSQDIFGDKDFKDR